MKPGKLRMTRNGFAHKIVMLESEALLVWINYAAIQPPVQCFKLIYPNSYSIYEVLEYVMELVLHNQIWEHVITIKYENLNHGCNQR